MSDGIGRLEELVDQSKSIRSKFEPDWFLNLAFYDNNQWVFWNRDRLDQPVLPKHKRLTLVTDNRILPTVQTRLAKKLKQRPVWTMTPGSPDEGDVEAAELSEVVMDYEWDALNCHDKLHEALQWADICAAGFWKISWDKTVGEKAAVLLGPDGEPLKDPDGRLMRPDNLPSLPPEMMQGLQQTELAKGDVRIDVRSPFEILPDPLAKSLHECEWIIEEVVQSEDFVRQHYGVELKGDTGISPGITEGRSFAYDPTGASGSYKGVKVYEMWSKPTTEYPEGRHVVWAQSKILHDDVNPYGCLPYVMFSGIPTPGRFWPSSIVTALRGPQIELNKIKTQVRENAQRVGNPAILISRQSNIDYSGVPGEAILFDDTMQNSVPTYLRPPELPAFVVQEIDRIESSIREISGQHEVSGSNVPAGVTAASAINLLLEQDDTRLGPAIQDMETQLGKAGSMLLKLIAEYYSEERTIKLAGEDGDWDIRGFKGEMLRGHTTIDVQAGSQMPTSKAAKQAAIRDTLQLFVQQGVPVDQRAMRKVLKDFQVGGLEHFFAEQGKDAGQVNREHRMLAQGQPIPLNVFDNHDYHLAEHDDFMKGARFSRFPAEIQALFLQHRQLHLQEMQRIQMEQQQAQMMQQQQQEQLKQGPPGQEAPPNG